MFSMLIENASVNFTYKKVRNVYKMGQVCNIKFALILSFSIV